MAWRSCPRSRTCRRSPPRTASYSWTAGYNEVINQRQFGVPGLRWPVEYRYPDRTYRDQLRIDVGGTSFELRDEKGETDDHTVTWVPGSRVLCCGDLFIWASPNAGNPQKVQRYPRRWAAALRRMIGLEPECLLPGHGLPIIDAGRVRQALTDTAELLESLVDQTLGVMNAGGRLDDAIHGVVPPRRLLDRPYLRPVYDEPEFIVHTVWRLYGGWWDGNPASLKPAPERALAAELAAVAGGAQALADRALALLAEARSSAGAARIEEALRLAGHLAELAWLAAPGTRGSGECGRRSIRPGQRRRPRRWPRECSGGRPKNRSIRHNPGIRGAAESRMQPAGRSGALGGPGGPSSPGAGHQQQPAAVGRAKPPPSASPTRTRSAAPGRRGC
jgi:glyoxylase-like metal-dependent hydrolase (beta-lactamase superfamily II)